MADKMSCVLCHTIGGIDYRVDNKIVCGKCMNYHGPAEAKEMVKALTEKAKASAVKDSGQQQEPESVNHPPHYGGDTTYEAIKVIEAWGLGFCLGNAVKYICRAGRKSADTLQDLEKARWYLSREIDNLKKG